MVRGHDRSGGNKAVALLATCLVVVAGAVTCAVIVITADARNASRSLWIWAACFGGIILVLWLLRAPRQGNRAATRWSWLSRRLRRKVEYRIGHRRRLRGETVAPIAPPTAERVREISGGINTWVPSPSAGNAQQRDSTPHGEREASAP